MNSAKAIFHPKLRAYQIWGTRQGVGKTLASTILCIAAGMIRGSKGAFYNVAFSKPYYDGDNLDEADQARIKYAFFKWREGRMPKWFDTRRPIAEWKGDGELLKMMTDYAYHRADYAWTERGQQPPASWLFFETLGGVESHLPSNHCQADVYRELQLPGLLVGDTQSHGVKDTISAFEALRRRDYDVQSVIVFKDPAENYMRISEHFDKLEIPCVALRALPDGEALGLKVSPSLMHYYSSMARANIMKGLLKNLQDRHVKRVKAMEQVGPSEELADSA